LDCGLPIHHLDWNEIRTLKLVAVDRDGIDLVGGIRGSHRSLCGLPIADEVRRDDFAGQPAPFALHSHDAIPQIECKVVPAMLRDRFQNVDPELDRLQRDRRLGDVALVVAREHPAILAMIR
jgi:hypothetical protein